MTKKDFVLIASVIEALDTILSPNDRDIVANVFCSALERDHPAFKPDVFLNACNVR